MKKKAISLLLVTAMVLSFALVAAPAAQASTTQQHPHEASTSHCSCGQAIDSAAITGHTHEATAPTWTPWTSIADVTDGGHYYLTADYAKQSGNYIKVETPFTLCLNGYTFYNKLDVYANMTVCDCSTTPGKVSSATSGTSTQGGVVQIRSATFNLFSAELVYTGTGVNMGGCVAINGDTNSTFNMFSGKLSGGKATAGSSNLGGSVFIGDKSKAAFNLYGGTVEGGSAKKGGSVYLHGQGALNIYGGTIESGTTTTASGTAIHSVYGAPTITYEGGTIIGGASGNVISYNNENTVSLGITKMGLEIAENGSVGVGYITGYTMTDGMKDMLTASADLNNTAYGLKLWTEDGTPVYAGYNDKNATAVGAHLKNIMNINDNEVDDATNAVVPVKGVAYAVIGKTVVESAEQSFTLKTLIEKMDSKLTGTAIEDLAALYNVYEDTMKNWTLPNIKAKAAA